MEYLLGVCFALVVVLGLRVHFLSSAFRAHVEVTSKHWEMTKETLPLLKYLVEAENTRAK